MLLYLALVAAFTLAVYLAAFRIAGWLKGRKGLTSDVTTGLFLIGFLAGLLLVGAFVSAGAMLTDVDRLAAGLLLTTVMATGLIPTGIILLKKNSDFS
ncbi:MAG: hypothetical protein LAT62_01520 [Natronospirillum sp.]|uniref:hypothetical protein n=1 Tax=Natronospirillum sp. TaxID=2812955 RepID=UPI0026009367|nr:hypothetical protein [Natronospirillum sp.]MCH8550583.1 hypothetical protein [Natronospirillum sp.]